jgi:hypothetical protein
MSGEAGHKSPLFVHSLVDDAGLTPRGFSVFNHMAELADRTGSTLIVGRTYYCLWDISSSDNNPGGAR